MKLIRTIGNQIQFSTKASPDSTSELLEDLGHYLDTIDANRPVRISFMYGLGESHITVTTEED